MSSTVSKPGSDRAVESLPEYWIKGAELMHQQCWCWGQDIQRPGGNLLLSYGFERSRPPEGVRGSSRYCIASEESVLVLWGFGAGYAVKSCGSIYVNRYCFVPRWACEATVWSTVWQPEQLAMWTRPCTRRQVRRSRRLLRAMIRRFAAYELWVLETQGVAYRQATLAHWTHTSIPADRMAAEWELLARHVEEPPP